MRQRALTTELAGQIAWAFLAAPRQQAGALAAQAALLFTEPHRWLLDLAVTVLAQYHGDLSAAPHAELAQAIEVSPVLLRAIEGAYFVDANAKSANRLHRHGYALAPIPQRTPTALRERLLSPLPQFEGAGDVARWLGVSFDELNWFSPAYSRHVAAEGPLAHYRYHVISKSNGRPRLLEAPKHRLATIQRKIARELLDAIPIHPATHGFVRGRSPLTHAREHCSKALVIRIDLADFFTSIRVSRVFALFRACGYCESVASVLARLVTHATPWRAIRDALPLPKADGQWSEVTRLRAAMKTIYTQPHLPQGAPSSPALANLCAFRLDSRLAAAAAHHGLTYSRYADDLTFSATDINFAPGRITQWVERIVLEEGFEPNPRKTQVMRPNGAQRVTGIVVNHSLNVARRDYDALKAQIYNCARGSWQVQNRTQVADFRRHLEGRVNWVEQVNSSRGKRLRALLAQIHW